MRGAWRGSRYWQAPFLLRVCLVTTKSDPESAFRGVLWRERGPWLVMRAASLIKSTGAPPVPIDGEIVIHRDNLAFIQIEP